MSDSIFPLLLKAPTSVSYPEAAGGKWSRFASKGVMPLPPRRWRIASATGSLPRGGILPGRRRDFDSGTSGSGDFDSGTAGGGAGDAIALFKPSFVVLQGGASCRIRESVKHLEILVVRRDPVDQRRQRSDIDPDSVKARLDMFADQR